MPTQAHAQCQSRCRECVYKPSRRGGPRGRRKPRLSEESAQPGEGISSEMDNVVRDEMPDVPLERETSNMLPQYHQRACSQYRTAISIQNYIDPGAGLKQLEDWFQDSDFIFDSLFMSGIPDATYGDAMLEQPSIPVQPIPMVRTYKSDDAM